MNADFLVYVTNMGVYRMGGDVELLCHIIGSNSAGDKHDDFRFARGKRELGG